MLVTQNYKTITLSVASYVDIDMALRLLIAQAKEQLKFMPLGDENDSARRWEAEKLNNLLLAQQELTA